MEKGYEEAGDRPRRARLPCPGHPPLGHFGRSANEVQAWSHPHLLRWLSTTVCPFEGLDAGLCPHLNLLSMLSRFEPDEAVRVATDSIYVKKTALCKLEGVGAYKPHEVHPKGYCRICLTCHDKATPRPPQDGIAPAQWRDKGKSLFMPMEHAAYLAKPEYKATKKDLTPSTAPRHDNPQIPTSAELPKQWRGQWQNHASDRALPYQKPPHLHPDPSSGQRDAGQGRPGPDLSQLLPLEQPNRLDAREDGTEIRSPCDHLGRGLHSAPPHSGNLPRLARGSGHPGHLLWRPGAAAPNCWRNARGVQAQTYDSFFRWSSQTDWTLERMGQKFVRRVIIWDEVCTVPRPTLETFLDWLEGRGIQVICCGDQGQPPPIAGEMPHDWLREHAAYYEEVEVDHRAKDLEAEGSRLGPEAAVRAP